MEDSFLSHLRITMQLGFNYLTVPPPTPHYICEETNFFCDRKECEVKKEDLTCQSHRFSVNKHTSFLPQVHSHPTRVHWGKDKKTRMTETDRPCKYSFSFIKNVKL